MRRRTALRGSWRAWPPSAGQGGAFRFPEASNVVQAWVPNRCSMQFRFGFHRCPMQLWLGFHTDVLCSSGLGSIQMFDVVWC